jgi:hypothetical protein
MPTIEKTLKALENWFLSIQGYTAERDKLRPESFLDEEDYYERKRRLDDDIRDGYKKMKTIVERYEREPERHFLRHSPKFDDFYKGGVYSENVFIMTKYPVVGEPGAPELQAVIDAVVAGISKRHYKPRVANTAVLHRWLWDNVELYLLGCARGVAIVEDKYAAELNPNVAMEWGWMIGMLRDVLFLREENFKHIRADWSGLGESTFDWANPVVGIEQALDKFLPVRPAPPAPPPNP